MSKRKSTTILPKSNRESKGQNGWAKAIRDATAMLGESDARSAELRRSIRIFQDLRDSGAAFPGERILLGQPRDL